MKNILKITCVLVIIFASKQAFCQELVRKSTHDYETFIDTVDLHKHISILASDSLEGRNTGEAGQKHAAAYIESVFMKNGISYAPGMKSYRQTFDLYKKKKSGTIKWNSSELKYPSDFGFLNFFQASTLRSSNIIYIKKINKFDFFNPQLKDAVLVVELNSLKDYDKDFWKDIPCKGLIFLLTKYDERLFVNYNDKGLILPVVDAKTPALFINKKSTGKVNEKTLNLEITLNQEPEKVQTENIIAYIEGSDPKLQKDVIVLSAHYDHIGIENGQIFNGADDNGSGTAALLEMGEALQQAKNEGKGLKRSVLLIAMTGEELGLFGSSYYASNPIIPLNKTIADLNIDMIGRKTSAKEKDTAAVYIIGSNMISEDLHKANEQANKQFTHLKLDYEYNSVDHPLKLYFRSDHYNFAKFGVPSIFYFGGFHDDYHQATDDIEKLNFDKIEQVSKLVFHTCCILGNKISKPSLKM